MTDVRRHWPALLADHTAIRDRLLAAYGDPWRSYHDLRHLAEVLDHVDLLARTADDVDRTVVLAAWFHDAVYEGTASDEERSAVLAERELARPRRRRGWSRRWPGWSGSPRPPARADGDLAGRCCATRTSRSSPPDPGRYADYGAGVRQEYAHVDDDRLPARPGRACCATCSPTLRAVPQRDRPAALGGAPPAPT